MVIIFFVELILASNSILAPLASFSLSVIKLFTRSASVIGSLLVFLISVLNVIVRFVSTGTPVSVFDGSKFDTEGVRVVAIEPLPVLVLPPTFIAKQLVYHVPEEVISKLLSISISLLDCVPLIPAKVTL